MLYKVRERRIQYWMRSGVKDESYMKYIRLRTQFLPFHRIHRIIVTALFYFKGSGMCAHSVLQLVGVPYSINTIIRQEKLLTEP